MTAGLKIWCFIHKNLRKWYKQETLPQDSFIQEKYAWWHLVENKMFVKNLDRYTNIQCT